MAAFKAGKKDVLIATDVAARGIDVNDVTHVINHTIPDDEKTYLHRAGRTGRAGKTGIAVTFVDWDDLHKWALINRALEFGQPEPDRDVLVEPAPVHRPRHPRGHEGPPRDGTAHADGARSRDAAAAAGARRPRAAVAAAAGARTERVAASGQRATLGASARRRAEVPTEHGAPRRPTAPGTHDGGGKRAPRRQRRAPPPPSPPSADRAAARAPAGRPIHGCADRVVTRRRA